MITALVQLFDFVKGRTIQDLELQIEPKINKFECQISLAAEKKREEHKLDYVCSLPGNESISVDIFVSAEKCAICMQVFENDDLVT